MLGELLGSFVIGYLNATQGLGTRQITQPVEKAALCCQTSGKRGAKRTMSLCAKDIVKKSMLQVAVAHGLDGRAAPVRPSRYRSGDGQQEVDAGAHAAVPTHKGES